MNHAARALACIGTTAALTLTSGGLALGARYSERMMRYYFG